MVSAVDLGGLGTDRSANAPALLANLLCVVAPNFHRLDFIWQNQSGNTHQVVLDDGAGGTPTVFLCGPGGGPGTQGAALSLLQDLGIRHFGQIRVLSASSLDQGAGREY